MLNKREKNGKEKRRKMEKTERKTKGIKDRAKKNISQQFYQVYSSDTSILPPKKYEHNFKLEKKNPRAQQQKTEKSCKAEKHFLHSLQGKKIPYQTQPPPLKYLIVRPLTKRCVRFRKNSVCFSVRYREVPLYFVIHQEFC